MAHKRANSIAGSLLLFAATLGAAGCGTADDETADGGVFDPIELSEGRPQRGWVGARESIFYLFKPVATGIYRARLSAEGLVFSPDGTDPSLDVTRGSDSLDALLTLVQVLCDQYYGPTEPPDPASFECEYGFESGSTYDVAIFNGVVCGGTIRSGCSSPEAFNYVLSISATGCSELVQPADGAPCDLPETVACPYTSASCRCSGAAGWTCE